MPTPSRTRESHGERRRQTILETAADLGTEEGLEGLSIARLAAAVGLSKSGVAAHFDSKEALQLAAVEAAAEAYDARVRSLDVESGLPRLEALMGAWIDHIEGIAYRGGCFFAATGHEFSARPGPVRNRIAVHTRAWITTLEREARLAIRLGEVRADVEPGLLVFQLHALVQEANLRRRLLDDDGAFDDARALAGQILASAQPSTS